MPDQCNADARDCHGGGVDDNFNNVSISTSKPAHISTSKLARLALVFAGTISLAFGIFGIFLPILPTTPFLLLAAGCYSRSSPTFYKWLMNNKWFGTHIRNYREKRGVPLRIKVVTISYLWVTIILSAFVMIQIELVSIILILIATGVTIHILSIRTLND